jgi:hypothetical protein
MLPVATQFTTKAQVFNVNKKILPEKTQEETVGRKWPGKAIFA